MRVDALSVELRPRPMSEAADLGVLLVQRNARSVWLSFTPLYAVVVLLAAAMVEIAPWLASFSIFWLKPWLDRSLLFILSRAVFGQSTRFADLWANRSFVWWNQWLVSLTLRRLSPWRSFTQAIYQLEGQRGNVRRQRRDLLLRARRGSAGAMHFVFSNVEMALVTGTLAIAAWFAPEGTRGSVMGWLFDSGAAGPNLVFAAVYAGVVFLLEPFYVAAGFVMYLNRRVELEAWDIEQDFRRAFGS